MAKIFRLLLGGTCQRCGSDITRWRSDGFCSGHCRVHFDQDVLHP